MKRIFILLLCVVMLTVGLPVAAADSDKTAATEKVIPLLSCDTVDNWKSEADIALDTEDKTEGEASVSFTGSFAKGEDSTVSIEAAFPAVEIAGANVLTFDFYISDPTLLHSTYILTVDLSSSGGPESNMLDWAGDVFQAITEPGWYHVSLPFDKALNLSFDDTNVNYLRMYLFHIIPEEDLTDVVIKIDNVAVKIPSYRSLTVENCDTAEGWHGNKAPYAAAPVLDRANKKEGAGSIQYTVTLPQEVHLVSHKVYATPFNVKGATHVEMDVYVSDVNVFKNCRYAIQFEITSSGTCDHQEYSWSLDDYIHKNGWTRIRLPIGAASPCDGAPNMSAINYFRFHTLDISAATNNQLIFRVDNISFAFPSEQEAPAYGLTAIGGNNEDGNGDENGDENGGENHPPLPDIPGPGNTTEDNTEKELRARQTARRAKVLLLIMTFGIIGVDVVAVALKRKKQEEVVTNTGDVPPDEVN